MTKNDSSKLQKWFQENQRPLPWRENRDPYRIWISETMLQQTTTQAVIPFFKKFLKKFPTVKSLAKAEEADVLEAWSGLGYYSRARNLHKAAKEILQLGSFPQSYEQLIQLPGFGPYTSRAVSSIAFSENVGVLDGNVIRILSRKENLKAQWWKTAERKQLQELADKVVYGFPANELNQAMMELGATICTPTSPTCYLCPWLKSCKSHKTNEHLDLPLKKPKKTKEIWIWEPYFELKKKNIPLTKNTYSPFLKNQWLFPGTARKVSAKPKSYDFKHNITHHEIYVCIKNNQKNIKKDKEKTDINWVHIDSLKKWNPASLLQKVIKHYQ